MSELEKLILRAVAIIESHTIRRRVALEQTDFIEAEGYSAERFIWFHTKSENDPGLHDESVARGAWNK